MSSLLVYIAALPWHCYVAMVYRPRTSSIGPNLLGPPTFIQMKTLKSLTDTKPRSIIILLLYMHGMQEGGCIAYQVYARDAGRRLHCLPGSCTACGKEVASSFRRCSGAGNILGSRTAPVDSSRYPFRQSDGVVDNIYDINIIMHS